MPLLIEPPIWKLFPGMTLVVAVARGIDNRRPRPGIEALLQQAQDDLAAGWSYDNPQSHPHIAAWRQAAAAMGISGKRYPSSIEALCRRVVSGRPLASINPVVDLYNALSLAEVVPVGGWDVDALAGGVLQLRRTREGEPFQELGAAETVPVGADEVSYTDDEQVITRHFVWRQAERAKVTPATRNLFLVSEILPALDPAVAERMHRGFERHFTEQLGATVRTALLTAPAERWDWE